MIQLDSKYHTVLLEALEDMLYKLSLELENYKGEPMDKDRKKLTKKQQTVEEILHEISGLG